MHSLDHIIVLFSFYFESIVELLCQSSSVKLFQWELQCSAIYPWLPLWFQCIQGLWSQILGSQSWGSFSLDWTHLCNKNQGQFQGGDTSLTCLELSFPGTALGWVLHCPFWISGVTQVNYPVLVIWMRDNSKLLKTDIFPSQLPKSAARDKCSRALWVDVVLLNVMRGKGSAVKCDGSLSQLSGIYCWAFSIM